MDNINAKKVFLPTGFSSLFHPTYEEYYKTMMVVIRKFDALVFHSSSYRDIVFAENAGCNSNIFIIPNGADEREFEIARKMNIRRLLEIPDNHSVILHVGSHSGQKGHSEAFSIFRQAKMGPATLLIVGNDPGYGCKKHCYVKKCLFSISPARFYDNKRIVITELGREQTVAAFQQADIFLFPSQIECSPIVLFEAMASKTPFLTSGAGNGAEIVNWSKGGGFLLDTVYLSDGTCRVNIKKSISMLEHLLRDNDKRIASGEKGFEVWRTTFTWSKIVLQYEALFKKLILNY